ncbi:MAG: polysaccharide biosynthesis protein [Clostridia bacterium]|nr:polysaccharide biosynthesis protein [Clostridia bacterium]
MSSKNQIKIGAILSYVQIIASVVIGIVYTPIMLRMLGKSEYGLYNIISSVASMLALLSLGFNTCYIRYYSKYKKRENPEVEIYKLNGLFLIIFLIIGVVALACGLFLRSNLELVFAQGLTAAEYEIARRLMLLVSINLAISFPMSVFSNIISAHERFVFLKSLNVIKTVASPFLTIPLLLLGFRSVALVFVTLVVSIAIDIVFLFYFKYNLKQKFIFKGFEPGIVRSLFGYTFFIALHMIVDQINWNVDKLLLGRLRGTEETAIYSVGFTLYSYYMTIGLPIAGMFTPRIHSLVEDTKEDLTSRKRYLTELFVKVGRIQWLILSLVMTGLIFFGKPFIAFWAGDGYERAYFVCLLLVIPGTIDLIQNMGIEIQRAQNKHRFRSYIYMAMAAINVVLSAWLCSRYGAVGSAIGTAISLVLVQGIIINIYLHKKCNIDVIAFWKNMLRLSLGLVIPCVFGVVIVSCFDLYSIGKLILAIALYVLVFCISMWLFGMNNYEKKMVLKFKGRFISMRFLRKIRFPLRDRIINSRNRKQ